jgi:hypothetical protein
MNSEDTVVKENDSCQERECECDDWIELALQGAYDG